MLVGQVVDTESAREFMRETLARVSLAELDAIAGEVEAKAARFAARLGPGSPRPLSPATLRSSLRAIFSTRRRADAILAAIGAERLGAWIDELLDGTRSLDERFEAFCARLAAVPRVAPFDLASELLHYTEPERYWLWTRWMWDPETARGALSLVTMDEVALGGAGLGETYRRVGQAVAFVHATGRAAGFTRIGREPFGASVYLACVYCVYVYTAVRLRLTQEFNQVIPPLPELCRRFLGVHDLEAAA